MLLLAQDFMLYIILYFLEQLNPGLAAKPKLSPFSTTSHSPLLFHLSSFRVFRGSNLSAYSASLRLCVKTSSRSTRLNIHHLLFHVFSVFRCSNLCALCALCGYHLHSYPALSPLSVYSVYFVVHLLTYLKTNHGIHGTHGKVLTRIPRAKRVAEGDALAGVRRRVRRVFSRVGRVETCRVL